MQKLLVAPKPLMVSHFYIIVSKEFKIIQAPLLVWMQIRLLCYMPLWLHYQTRYRTLPQKVLSIPFQKIYMHIKLILIRFLSLWYSFTCVEFHLNGIIKYVPICARVISLEIHPWYCLFISFYSSEVFHCLNKSVCLTTIQWWTFGLVPVGSY